MSSIQYSVLKKKQNGKEIQDFLSYKYGEKYALGIVQNSREDQIKLAIGYRHNNVETFWVIDDLEKQQPIHYTFSRKESFNKDELSLQVEPKKIANVESEIAMNFLKIFKKSNRLTQLYILRLISNLKFQFDYDNFKHIEETPFSKFVYDVAYSLDQAYLDHLKNTPLDTHENYIRNQGINRYRDIFSKMSEVFLPIPYIRKKVLFE